jgi:hypothetical protein
MRARFLATLLLLASASAATAPASKVAIRIAPEVDSQYPQLRSQIAATGVAEIAEPADLLLTTGDELTDYAELDPVGEYRPDVIRLGKLSSGEAQAVIPRILALVQRQKALIDLAKAGGPDGIKACKVDSQQPDKCLSNARLRLEGALSPILVRNNSNEAKFISVLEATSKLGIGLTELRASEAITRLFPGDHVLIPPSGFGTVGESHQIVIVADHGFDPAAFIQPSPFTSNATCFVRAYPECVRDAPPLPALTGLSAIGFTYQDQNRKPGEDDMQPAMGGAHPVARGDADWMVELYSTLPYTAAEIEADSKLPPAEQKHLAQRSPAELAHACGGTMIGRDLVLTAAHCVATGRFLPPNESRVFTDRRARLGSLLLGRGGETRAIVGMVIHEGYSGQGSGLPDDIALLLLKSDEPIRLGVRSLKLSMELPRPGTEVVGLGWGYTQAVAPGANVLMSMSDQLQHNPDNLQVAPLEVLASTDCNKRVGGKLRPGMLCLVTPKAVLAAGGTATFSCRGDSGGPLVRNYATSQEELVGLTSWSLGCGYKDTPSVYTDAVYFSRWVDAARKAIRPGVVVRVGDPAQSH